MHNQLIMSRKNIDKYIVLRELGEGSYGKVYQVVDPSTGGEFAVKAIKLSEAKSVINELKMMMNEKLKNEYLVRYYSSFSDDSYMYIIMEYMEEGNLLNLKEKEKQPLKEKTILKIFLGIEILYDNELIRSDKHGEIKIADFGAMKYEKGSTSSTGLGTMGFVPIEVLNGGKSSKASDLFGVGCVIYELMALRGPFYGSNHFLLVKNVMNDNYPAITANYSSELKNVVYSLLEKFHHPGPLSSPQCCPTEGASAYSQHNPRPRTPRTNPARAYGHCYCW